MGGGGHKTYTFYTLKLKKKSLETLLNITDVICMRLIKFNLLSELRNRFMQMHICIAYLQKILMCKMKYSSSF